jgi:hypothetical protein
MATGSTGTLVTYSTTNPASYSLHGTWSLGADSGSVTIPLAGTYNLNYSVSCLNNSTGILGIGATLSTTTYIRVNGIIIPGFSDTWLIGAGYSVRAEKTNILTFNAGDIVQVYAIASGNGMQIEGTGSLVTGDSTSTTIVITNLK